MQDDRESRSKFQQAGEHYQEQGILRELWTFIISSKKYWMIPIVATLVLFGALILLAGTGAAPFIYTLF